MTLMSEAEVSIRWLLSGYHWTLVTKMGEYWALNKAMLWGRFTPFWSVLKAEAELTSSAGMGERSESNMSLTGVKVAVAGRGDAIGFLALGVGLGEGEGTEL